MNGRMYYKAGDEVRMRKTDYTGIIAGVIANGRAYWVIFENDVFGEAPIRCYGNEIEPTRIITEREP